MMYLMSVSQETVVALWTGMHLIYLLRGPWMPGIGWVLSKCLFCEWMAQYVFVFLGQKSEGFAETWGETGRKAQSLRMRTRQKLWAEGVSVSRLLCREDSDPSSGPEDNWWGGPGPVKRPRQKGQKSSCQDTQRDVNERCRPQCSCQPWDTAGPQWMNGLRQTHTPRLS